jgi:hypothetical protein
MNIPVAESVLSQFKSPADTTPITEVGRHFARIRIFREFRTSPGSQARWGIATTAPKDTLLDGSDNLALVLHELDFLGVHDRIRNYLRRFCERFEDVKVRVGQGLAQVYLQEAGLPRHAVGNPDVRWNPEVSRTAGRSVPSETAAPHVY